MLTKVRAKPTIWLYPSVFDEERRHYFGDLYDVSVVLEAGERVDGDFGGKAYASLLYSCIPDGLAVWVSCDDLDETEWLEREGVQRQWASFNWHLLPDSEPAPSHFFRCGGPGQFARFVNYYLERGLWLDEMGVVVSPSGAPVPGEPAQARLVFIPCWDGAKLLVGGDGSFDTFAAACAFRMAHALRPYQVRLRLREDEPQ